MKKQNILNSDIIGTNVCLESVSFNLINFTSIKQMISKFFASSAQWLDSVAEVFFMPETGLKIGDVFKPW